ncbi:MAG: hypothetical protein AAF151_24595, partial [Cyanobacteria bacterium J06656_5]
DYRKPKSSHARISPPAIAGYSVWSLHPTENDVGSHGTSTEYQGVSQAQSVEPERIIGAVLGVARVREGRAMSDLIKKIDLLTTVVSELKEQQLERDAKQSAEIELLRQQLKLQQMPVEVASIKEAAQQLSIGESTLRGLIDNGEFISGDEVIRLNGNSGSYRINIQAYLTRKAREQRKNRVC